MAERPPLRRWYDLTLEVLSPLHTSLGPEWLLIPDEECDRVAPDRTAVIDREALIATLQDRPPAPPLAPQRRTYRDLLRDPAVDLVCIALPNHLHAEATIAAAELGKPVLVEKPMASTVAECDAMVRAVRRTGVPLMVAHPYRYMAPYREAKRLIEAGEIGRPVFGTAAMVKDWTFDKREPWHLAPGGGMWLTNACHLVDRLSWLLDALPTDIRATVGAYFHPQEADDAGVGLIGFDSGATGVVRAIGYRAGAVDNDTEIQGTEGALRVSHADGVFLGRNDHWEPVAGADPGGQLAAVRAEWEDFLRYVRDGGPSPVSVEYGRHVVATVAAGLESSATGQVVRISRG